MLMRFDPFRDFDRLTEELWGGPRSRDVQRAMAMDAYREDDHFVVHFDLPGVDPDSIEVTVENDTLSVKASRSWERTEDRQYVATERFRGTYQRQLLLGDSLDADRIDANYHEGVLTLRVPVAERAKPRRIEVGRGGDPHAISAESRDPGQAA